MLAREGLGLQLEPEELQLVLRWFGNDGGANAPSAHAEHPGASPIDYDLFLQHFWALGTSVSWLACVAAGFSPRLVISPSFSRAVHDAGAAAKTRLRKEEAQERFFRVLASAGISGPAGAEDEGASG